jgi:hypothetical protein
MKKVVIAGLFLLSLPLTIHAQQSENLRGLGGVKVGYSIVGDARGDISGDELKTYVEMRLREARITVVDGDLPPRLVLNINTLKIGPTDNYAIVVSLSLWRLVTLSGRTKKEVRANVWEITRLSILHDDRLDDLRQAVQGHMDYFINDFLKVNYR